MSKNELRQILLKNRDFFHSLFQSNSNAEKRSLLLKSSVEQVDTLIKILFYIVQGEIPLKKSNFEALQKFNKLSVLHEKFNTLKKLNFMLSRDFKQKTSFLLKFTNFYKYLLHNLFFKN